jgi:hypothetical protein
MVTALVTCCYEELTEFGKQLVVNGKAIWSYAVRPGKKGGDRRGEQDADGGRHEQMYRNPTGEIVQTVKKWFGFTLHVVADTWYKLPVDYTLSKSSRNE